MNQKTALDILKTGRNVFLTGSAGTGKTFVINQYTHYLKKHSIDPTIVAPTGIAASHIGGITIHSFFGLGIKEQLSDFEIDLMYQNEYLYKRLSKVKILIIDEISMVSPMLFNTIDKLLQIFKDVNKSFGGVQLIVSGDFFQLPPISSSKLEIKYAFQTNLWKKTDFKVCYLTKKYRQDDDILINSLDEIRNNKVSKKTIKHFQKCQTKVFAKKNKITKLYTHNIDVDQINNQELDKLKSKAKIFVSNNSGSKKDVKRIFNTCFAVPELSLKKDAVVLFIKNNPDKGYINGTLGRIIAFDKESGFPKVKTFTGDKIIVDPVQWEIENKKAEVVAKIHQIPLKLAWAITIHKSQGMTIDAAEIDLSKTFEIGQGYVALSRLKSISGLKLLGFNNIALTVDNIVLAQDKIFRQSSLFLKNQFKDFSEKKKQTFYKDFIIKNNGILKEIKISKKENISKIKQNTIEETIKLIKEKKSIKAIAKDRNLKTRTILNHIEKIASNHSKIDISYLFPDKTIQNKVSKAIKQITKDKDPDNFLDNGNIKLRAIYKYLNKEIDYDAIKLCLIYFAK